MKLFITLFVCLVSISVALGDGVDIKNPVRSAAEDEIKNLPEINYDLGFKHYSGYLNGDDEDNKFIHYWFVESRSNPGKDPLILWLNGGPGCSSTLGLLTELGPYELLNDGSLVNNKHAWNKKASVLFFESPTTVGYSYSAKHQDPEDDDTTAKQNHRALQSFFTKFPQFEGRDLYLTGESYAGVYLPTLAVLVDKDREMNLKGVAIGNGYLDAKKNAESLVFFSYYHGLVGKKTWEGLSKFCCDGKPPARGECHLTDPNKSVSCQLVVHHAIDDILQSGINPYNLYDICVQDNDVSQTNSLLTSSSWLTSRETFDKNLLLNAFNMTSRSSRFGGSFAPKQFERLRGDPPCVKDDAVENYLNRDDVRKSLNIPEALSVKHTACSDTLQYTMIYPDSKNGLAPQIKQLINSGRRLKLLVYNGDTDLMCNFLGDEWFVDDLGRKLISEYTTWKTQNQVAGFVKKFDGITYMTVKGSGHMVPTDKPAEALHMIEHYLLN